MTEQNEAQVPGPSEYEIAVATLVELTNEEWPPEVRLEAAKFIVERGL